MINVLAIGDPHFQLSNISEVEEFMINIEKKCKVEKPDMIIILGDLLHTHERVHIAAMNKAFEFVHKMRAIAYTVILVGNHDMLNPSQFLTENHWMNAMKLWDNVKIVDKVFHLDVQGINLVFCPFVPNGRFNEALDTIKEEFDWKSADCIFAHQEFKGVKMGAMISELGDVWDDKNPFVICGHIHSKQNPQPNICYTGTPFAHAFGESKDNIVVYATIKKNQYPMIREIDLELRNKRIIYMDIDDAINLTSSHKIFTTPDLIKLSVTGTADQIKTFEQCKIYKTLQKAGIKVATKPSKLETMTEKDINTLIDFKDILQELILREKDSRLYYYYNKIVNNTDVGDVLIL